MDRRRFLATGGIAVAFGMTAPLLSGCDLVPVFPQRPDPDAETALGWIGHRDGRYTLRLPRAEIGQNIGTALKQVACEELGAGWDEVAVVAQDTDAIARVRATVGSESVRDFAEPLAQACATLRDALARGAPPGELLPEVRPRADLRAFRGRRFVGRSPEPDRLRDIVAGRPLFAADMTAPGMAHGRVLRAAASPETGSRPAAWNLQAARAFPGFVAVVESDMFRLGASQGLGIVAETPGALDRIAAALDPEWAVDAAAPPEIGAVIDIDRTDAGAAHSLADDSIAGDRPWDVDLRLDLPVAAHGGIEPRAALAVPSDGGMAVWTGTQDAFYVRDVLARGLGLAEDRVTVHATRAGGAFGARTICTVEAEAAALAQAAGRPVKVRWTRAQEYAQGFHRPPVSHRLRLRVDADRPAAPRLSDWQHRLVSSHILFTNAAVPPWLQALTDTFVGDGGVARGAEPPYRIARRDIGYDLVRLPVFTGPWRGLAAGPNGLAVESAIDAAALAAGADPLAFRLALVAEPRLAAVLRRLGEVADWPAPAARRPGFRTGRGLACGTYKGLSHAAAAAEVAVAPDGTVQVTRLWCVHDCGAIINPDQVRAQVEGNLAWGLSMVLMDDLPIEYGAVTAASFADAPIPRMSDMPPIAVELVESDAPPAGAGETAIVAAPGAIANAVRAATGIRPRRFPLVPADFALA
ncbi:molybdopterin cofactor-binding domain-containing protein [Marinibaculum pumilum]|uniref:Molybdopterin cofactor-binding domain-containing protein n=1 Tax=Marinibaculum pumilum TaxID=1766165 RepID=A0ABV7L7I2_9PROT